MPTWQYGDWRDSWGASPVFMSGTNVVHLTYDEEAAGGAIGGETGGGRENTGFRLDVGDEGVRTSGGRWPLSFGGGW